MYKFKKILALAFCFMLMFVFILASCDDENNSSTDSSSKEDSSEEKEYIIEEAKGFEVDKTGSVVKLSKKVSNATELVDISSEITVTKGATWKLYKDFLGEEEYKLKSMVLSIGENKAHLIVYHPNGDDFVRYEVTIYRLDIKEYTFVADGKEYQGGEIEELSKIEAPTTNPQKAGYTFAGWTINGKEITFPYTVENDTEFVAKLKANENTLVFDANGGNGSMSNMTLATDASKNLISNTFTKAGYTFKGWSTSANGGVVYQNGASYTMGTNSTYTLYAVWQANNNTLVFNANGGNGSMSNMTIATDASATLTTNAFTKAGYTFKGWSTSANGGVVYQNGASYTMGTNSTYTLYAVWQIVPYNIEYRLNNGTNGANPSEYTVEQEIMLKNPTRAGYTFDGWYTESTFVNKVTAIAKGTTGNKTFYAKWTPNNNTLVFNANGGSGSMSNMTIATDASATLTTNAFTRVGYTFKGWSTSANGGVVYQNGAIYKMGTNSTYILYAVWVPTKYDITYKLNEFGEYTFENSNPTTYTVEDKITLKAPTISSTYYDFVGWYSDKELKNQVTVIENSTGDITLYAKWATNDKALTFTRGNGEYSVADRVTDIDIVIIPDTYKGLPVTTIRNFAFEDRTALTSIVIPNSVTAIGERAFYECASLTSVTIGNSVTSIGEYAFYGCTSLTSIEIPNSVTTIEHYAFEYCASLTSVTIGNSVKTIGEGAFRGCTSLTSVEIPNSVTSIGNQAFYGCKLLTSVTISNSVTSIGEGAFEGCTSLTSIEIPNSVTSIGYHAFYGCESLTSIIIPNSVTTIGSNALYGCKLLTIYCEAPSQPSGWNLYWNSTNCPVVWGYIGKTGTTDDGFAYKFVRGGVEITDYTGTATELEIPSTICGLPVTTIGNFAFEGCESLTSVTIGNSVTSIGYNAFEGCTSLTSIVIPNSVTSIGNRAFTNCYKLTSIEIPNSVTTIGDYAFCNCTSLTSVTIPNSVTSIGSSAFSGCTSLTSIIIPNSVTTIEYYAFYGCTSLTSIAIPNSVTSIGYYAFNGCTALTIYCEAAIRPVSWNSNWNYSDCPVVWGYIGKAGTTYDGFAYKFVRGGVEITDYTGTAMRLEIPSAIGGLPVTTIGNCAFDGCESLTSVTIPNSVITIGNWAFRWCESLTSIVIPNSVKTIEDYAFAYCTSLTSIEVDENNTVYKSIDGNLYSKDGKTLVQYAAGKADDSFVIPNSVTSIGNGAFSSCKLTSIVIPNSVTTIGRSAFYECRRLTSIEIPNSVKTIEDYAFDGCESLTSIEIPNSVTTIGDYAFCYCYNLTSIEIPNGVTSIGYYAFYDCKSLTSIEIPNSVTTIEEYAFRGCTKLTIYCEAQSQPSGWDSSWNYSNRPVEWEHIHAYENGSCVCGKTQN